MGLENGGAMPPFSCLDGLHWFAVRAKVPATARQTTGKKLGSDLKV
jgi:hypothetical protein